MNRCFTNIMDMNEDALQANIVDLMMLCLDSIIHLSDALKRLIQLHPGHLFC